MGLQPTLLGGLSFITMADGRALRLIRLGADWARNGCLVAHFHDQYCGIFLISYTKYSGGNYYKIRCIGDRDTPTFYTDGIYIYLKENYSGGTSAKVVLLGSTEKLESISIDTSTMTELSVTQ